MLSRRNFLRGFLGGLALFLNKSAFAARTPENQLLVERMRVLINDEKSAFLVGRCCLQGQAETGLFSSEKIAAAILEDLGLGESEVWLIGDRHLREMISRQIRLDFEREDLVNVDGWVLSVTEVRIYSLMAIS